MKTFLNKRFTVVGWLVLIATSATVTMAHAEETFDGHRLFFTESQRDQSALRELNAFAGRVPEGSNKKAEKPGASDAANTATSGGGSIKPGSKKARQRRLPKGRDQRSVKHFRVYFTGLVTGMRDAQVLVNGLPCDIVFAEPDEKPQRPLPLHCHGVRDKGLTLTVSADTAELLVRESGGRVHRLLPGEGL